MRSRGNGRELARKMRHWFAARVALLGDFFREAAEIVALAGDGARRVCVQSVGSLRTLSRLGLSTGRRRVIAAVIALGLPAGIAGNAAWEGGKSMVCSLYRLVSHHTPLTITEYHRELVVHQTGAFGQCTNLVEVVRGPNGVLKERELMQVCSGCMSEQQTTALAQASLERRGESVRPATIVVVQNTSDDHIVPSDFAGPIRFELSGMNACLDKVNLEALGFQTAEKVPTFPRTKTIEMAPFFLRSGDGFAFALGSPTGPISITSAWGGPVRSERAFTVLHTSTVAR